MKILNTFLSIVLTLSVAAQDQFDSDIVKTSDGDLTMTFIGHGTLMFQFNNMLIHIDPTMREADYSTMPDADLVLITHQHGDHLDPTALKHIMKKGTQVVMTETCSENLEGFSSAIIMKNGESKTINGIFIEAIPAYNIVHKRSNGKPFHPKGEGNAYLLSFGDKKVLIGGDTENIPEIEALKDIDIAFLPMNLPYTMTPEMVADAARAFKPSILYPYHFGDTDPQELVELLKNEDDIEVRVRKLD